MLTNGGNLRKCPFCQWDQIAGVAAVDKEFLINIIGDGYKSLIEQGGDEAVGNIGIRYYS